MGIRLQDHLATLPADEQAEIAEGTARLIEEEATLRQLREACGLTREAVGEAMGVPPAAVSHVRAMGGELYLVAKLPGKKPTTIKGIG